MIFKKLVKRALRYDNFPINHCFIQGFGRCRLWKQNRTVQNIPIDDNFIIFLHFSLDFLGQPFLALHRKTAIVVRFCWVIMTGSRPLGNPYLLQA